MRCSARRHDLDSDGSRISGSGQIGSAKKWLQAAAQLPAASLLCCTSPGPAQGARLHTAGRRGNCCGWALGTADWSRWLVPAWKQQGAGAQPLAGRADGVDGLPGKGAASGGRRLAAGAGVHLTTKGDGGNAGLRGVWACISLCCGPGQLGSLLGFFHSFSSGHLLILNGTYMATQPVHP